MNPFAVLAVCGLAASASAQVIEWDNASGGVWNDAANWSPINVPDTITETAEISLAGTYTVAIASVSPAIAALDLLNANAVVQLNGGRSLTLDGALANNGLLLVNQGNIGATTILQFNNNAAMSGMGTLRLNGISSRAIVRGANTSVVVSQSADHAIKGYGLLQLGLDSDGLIEADIAGQPLELTTVDKFNAGTISATNGANLDINSITVTQTSGGLITVDSDALIEIISGSIVGGTVAQVGTGAIETVGTSSFENVTTSGEVAVRFGGNLDLQTLITNNGVLRVNRNNIGATTIARFATDTLLTGSGELRLDGDSSRALLSSINSDTIGTNDGTHSIRGYGQISARLVNHGLVEADVAGKQLLMNTLPKVNNTAMRATNSAELQINSIAIDQTGGGTLWAAAGGNLNIVSGTIIGGDIVQAGGAVTNRGNSTYDGVEVAGGMEIVWGSVANVVGGLVNNGTIDVNPGNIGAVTDLRYNSSGSLTGSGEVRLGGITSRARILGANSAISINHGPNHTISGFGQVQAALTNNGTITADVDMQELQLLTEPKTNNAAMNATGGGTLLIQGIPIDQTGGGTIAALANGTVNLNSASIIGGSITRGPTGTVLNNGTSTYQNVSVSGGIEVVWGSIFEIVGGMLNNGSVAVNPNNIGAVTDLRFRDNATLAGSGEVVLAGVDARARVTSLNSGVTGTNGANHTIRGFGQIIAPLVNNGSIAADQAGRTLLVTSGAKLNNGVMGATNGGNLSISSVAVEQSAAGRIIADNGTIDVVSGSLTGGKVRSLNGGEVRVSGGQSVTDIEFDADVSVQGGASLNTLGSLRNDGNIVVNPTNGAIVTQLRVDESMTYEGSGSILLAGIDSRARIIPGTAGNILTNGPGHTIGGVGQLAIEVVNNGIIAPGLSAGDLDVFNPITCGPTSEIQIELAGENAGEFDRILSGSSIVLDGTIDVRLIDGYAPTGRTVYEVISTSGGITGEFDAITGDDAGNGLVLKWATDGNVLQVAYTCPSDIGFPLGTADIDDVLTFLNAFANQSAIADLAPPQGVFNIDDVLTFLDAFAQGCP